MYESWNNINFVYSYIIISIAVVQTSRKAEMCDNNKNVFIFIFPFELHIIIITRLFRDNLFARDNLVGRVLPRLLKFSLLRPLCTRSVDYRYTYDWHKNTSTYIY